MRTIDDVDQKRKLIRQFRLNEYTDLDLMEAARLVRYERDEVLCDVGDIPQSFYILLEGECYAYSVTDSKIHCERVFEGFNIMGFVSVLWGEPAINTIKAITPCTILTINADNYRHFLLNDVKFLRYALKWMADHMRRSAGHFESFRVRLSQYILENSSNGVFNQNLTLCADFMEVSYRHLLRYIRMFCDMGILEKEKRGSYRIIDEDALRNVVNG